MAARIATTTVDLPRVEPRWHAYALALVLSAAAVSALLVDMPVARICLAEPEASQPAAIKVPKELKKLLSLSEIFGYGSGAALVCLTWFVLDRSRRWSLPRVLTATFGAGLLADVVKLTVGRTRPNSFELSAGVAETFAGWVPSLRADDWMQTLDRQIQSFPSAHSATAAGLAVVLASFYPHARWLFALLAGLVMMQRVESGAHFVSDTLAGAALGCAWAGLCLDYRLLGRVFDHIEKVEGETPPT